MPYAGKTAHSFAGFVPRMRTLCFLSSPGGLRTFLLCCAWVALALTAARAQQPLTLAEAVRTGLSQSPAAHASADQMLVADAAVRSARLRPNPRLYLQSEDLQPWNSNSSFADNTEDYGYVSQSFELDGKRGKRIAYAERGVERGQSEHTLTLERLAGEIAMAYWAAEAAETSAAAWAEQLDAFNRLTEYQGARQQAGALAGVDLLRTQIERDRVALTASQAARDAENSRIELGRAMGLSAPEKAPLAERLEAERPMALLPPQTALAARPDVIAAHQSVAEAEANARLQHAYGVPDLDLLAGYKRDVGVDTAYGGLQIDLPFFNRNQGEIARTAAAERLAEDELAMTETTASAEIATAQNSYRREQGLVHTLVPGMQERSERDVAILADAYRSGGADLLRLLDAEGARISTRLLAIQTWLAFQQSIVTLEMAYGEQP